MEFSTEVKKKIATKHNVTEDEIQECFASRPTGTGYLKDNREDNRTTPPTLWFVSETDFGRKLKVVFIHKDGKIIVKTAYQANAEEIRIFNKYA